MSRSASAPSASKPSGMSERRVTSRVRMSALRISTSPDGFRSVRLSAFSRGHHARDAVATPRRHVHLPEGGIDGAVRVEDLRQELGAIMGAHAVEGRPDGRAEGAQLVARRAGADEQRAPPGRVARFGHVGQERGDDVASCSRGGGDRVQICRGFGRHLLVRVIPQACDVRGPETGRRDERLSSAPRRARAPTRAAAAADSPPASRLARPAPR